MSRARALELLELGSLDGSAIPAADAPASWWTVDVQCGAEADSLLSAMEELRDEYWLPQSVTPILSRDRGIVLVCVFRRISQDERLAMQRQAQAAPMVVDPRRLRTN